MFTLPLYTLLIIFGVFLLIWIAFFCLNLRDIIMSGSLNGTTAGVTMTIIALALLTILVAGFFLASIDWGAPIILFKTEWFSMSFSPQ